MKKSLTIAMLLLMIISLTACARLLFFKLCRKYNVSWASADEKRRSRMALFS